MENLQLTLDDLLRHHAPDRDVELFERYFGSEMALDRENGLKAIKVGFSLDWFTVYKLSNRQKAKYKLGSLALFQEHIKMLNNAMAKKDSQLVAALNAQYKLSKLNMLLDVVQRYE